METIIYISDSTSKKLLFSLFTVEAFLALCYILNNFLSAPILDTYSFFNLDGEYNLPSLFSFAQLSLVGFIFGSISYKKYSQTKSLRIFYFILCLGFIFLGFDEFFMIHEKIGTFINNHPNDLAYSFKGNHGFWILPYILLCMLMFILSIRTILKIYKSFKNDSKLIILGGSIFIFGALGLEIISYEFLRYDELPTYFYVIEVLFEELFEMIGISIILFSAIRIRSKTQNM